MLCLSGFELYSRWVPLPNEGIQQYIEYLITYNVGRETAELPLLCVTSIHSSPTLAISSVTVNTR